MTARCDVLSSGFHVRFTASVIASFSALLTVGGLRKLLGGDLTMKQCPRRSAYTPSVLTTPSAWRLRISLSL